MLPEIFRDEVFRLETGRLWLRWPRPEDAADIERFAGLQAVSNMTATWPHPLPEGAALDRINRGRAMTEAGKGLIYALTPRREPGRVIGTIGGAIDPIDGAFGLGYMLHPEHWGRGLVSEAAAGVVDMVFLVSRLPRITAGVRIVNPASRGVLVKTGFRLTGRDTKSPPARPHSVEEVEYFELTRAAWAERRRMASAARAARQGVP